MPKKTAQQISAELNNFTFNQLNTAFYDLFQLGAIGKTEEKAYQKKLEAETNSKKVLSDTEKIAAAGYSQKVFGDNLNENNMKNGLALYKKAREKYYSHNKAYRFFGYIFGYTSSMRNTISNMQKVFNKNGINKETLNSYITTDDKVDETVKKYSDEKKFEGQKSRFLFELSKLGFSNLIKDMEKEFDSEVKEENKTDAPTNEDIEKYQKAKAHITLQGYKMDYDLTDEEHYMTEDGVINKDFKKQFTANDIVRKMKKQKIEFSNYRGGSYGSEEGLIYRKFSARLDEKYIKPLKWKIDCLRFSSNYDKSKLEDMKKRLEKLQELSDKFEEMTTETREGFRSKKNKKAFYDRGIKRLEKVYSPEDLEALTTVVDFEKKYSNFKDFQSKSDIVKNKVNEALKNNTFSMDPNMSFSADTPEIQPNLCYNYEGPDEDEKNAENENSMLFDSLKEDIDNGEKDTQNVKETKEEISLDDIEKIY